MSWLVAGLILLGGVFALIAVIGTIRLPDFYLRMHAASKAGTFGAGLALIAAALHFAGTGAMVKAILVFLFLLLTAPVAAHFIGRAAWRAGEPQWPGTKQDELAGKNSDALDG